MTAEEMRAFYDRYVSAANAREFGFIASLIHDDIILNGKPAKREGAIKAFEDFAAAVPDIAWELEDIVIEGDRIAARLRDSGTPRAAFGVEPNGARVEFAEVAFYKIRDGRFAEMWFMIDVHSIAEQMKKK